MVAEDFWSDIAVFDGVVTPQGCAVLVDRLAMRGEAAILGFADELAAAVYGLDTPEHLAQSVWDVSEPDGPAIPMSEDVFLYARLAVVTAGRTTWQSVVADPSAMSGRWNVAAAEDLLDVAPQALRRSTGLEWDHESPCGMTTGSNTAAWGADALNEGEKWWRWYSCAHSYDLGADRDSFTLASHDLTCAIDTDDAWGTWWAHATVPDLELYPFYSMHVRDAPRLRKGRQVVRVQYSFDAAPLRFTPEEELPRLAADHHRTMLEFVRTRLRLPALPPLPPPAK
jgi:hypothetical protein